MSDYEIVVKPDSLTFSQYRGGSKPFWKPTIEKLLPNQALKFVCATKKEAKRKQSSAGTATRRPPKIKIHTRLIPESDKFILYIWRADAPQS